MERKKRKEDEKQVVNHANMYTKCPMCSRLQYIMIQRIASRLLLITSDIHGILHSGKDDVDLTIQSPSSALQGLIVSTGSHDGLTHFDHLSSCGASLSANLRSPLSLILFSGSIFTPPAWIMSVVSPRPDGNAILTAMMKDGISRLIIPN